MHKKNYYKAAEYNSFYELLSSLYEKHTKDVAIRYMKKKDMVEITYQRMLQEISNLAGFYQSNGIENVNIGILSENRYEYITIYFSAVFAKFWFCALSKKYFPEMGAPRSGERTQHKK